MRTSGTEQEIFQRADATLAVAKTLQEGASAYEWDEMTNAALAAKVADTRAARRGADSKKALFDAQRGKVNERFEALESLKIQGIGMAKYKFRKDDEVLSMLESIGEYGEAREDTLKEADEWSAAWGNIDPTYAPTPTNTRAAFDGLSSDAATQLKTMTNLKSDARKAGIDLNARLAEIEDLCVSWYGVATRAFPAGTTEGDLIRSQIPTFESGNAVTPTPAPAPNP